MHFNCARERSAMQRVRVRVRVMLLSTSWGSDSDSHARSSHVTASVKHVQIGDSGATDVLRCSGYASSEDSNRRLFALWLQLVGASC